MPKIVRVDTQSLVFDSTLNHQNRRFLSLNMASNIESTKEDPPWKERPCHFTWNLSAGDLTDFEGIIRKIDNDLSMSPDLLRVDQLLFRAYLEVSDRRLTSEVSKARAFLGEADHYIENRTETKLQPGYRRVALLNRIWIEHKSHNTEEVDKHMNKLKGLGTNSETDGLVVNTLLASALTRLGPTMATRSLQIYEEALQQFPDNAGFLFGALLMTGRKLRSDIPLWVTYEEMDEDGKKLMDNEMEYCEKLIKVNDKYRYGKSYLGMNFNRRKDRMDEARDLLEEAHAEATDVEVVFDNLIRFYRFKGRTNLELLNKAISMCEATFQKKPNHEVPESHHQLALCYITKAHKCSDNTEKKSLLDQALHELDKCLTTEPMHFVAGLKRAQLQAGQKENDDDKRRCYEDISSKHCAKLNQITVFHECAKIGSSSNININMCHKIMDLLQSFEYLNETSCRWEIRGDRAKDAGKTAFERLYKYYDEQGNQKLRLGILDFQNLDFEKATKILEELDPQTNPDIPRYLAESYLKWGREKELSKEPSEAVRNCYEKARRNVYEAREQGLNSIQCQKLLSDTALAFARFNLEKYTSQQSPNQIKVKSDCIELYSEAVRCGSLVASLEVLRLIEKRFFEKLPRSQFLRILAEIDICCSQRPSDCLHREEKPRSFVNGLNSRDTDNDTFALDCKKIKRHILTILRQKDFFRQAWARHFAMERKLLEERFKNNEGELILDGRKENSTKGCSIVETYAAIDCCEKLRPLLDHIIVKFRKEELGKKEERKDLNFPRFLEERELHKKLKEAFEIDFEEHFPILFTELVQVQPRYTSENDFLETFYTLVNHVKHSDIHEQDILKITKNPVELARQCTDKVEEICNFFFKAMKESSDLREKVQKVIGLQRQGMDVTCEQADELWGIITGHEKFIERMGTWKLLEMLSVIQQSSAHSDQHQHATNEKAEGTWEPSKKLRKSHLELEKSHLKLEKSYLKRETSRSQTANQSNKEVLKRCRDTCEEADKLLEEVMKKTRQTADLSETGFFEKFRKSCKEAYKLLTGEMKKTRQAADPSGDPSETDVFKKCRKACKEVDELLKGVIEKTRRGPQDRAEVEFPFPEIHKGNKTTKMWKNEVKLSIRTSLNNNYTDDVLKAMLQAQPCSNEENYNFLLMRKFLKDCDGASGAIPSSVSIQTDKEQKSLDAVDLTRWCTNNAEKIALQFLL